MKKLIALILAILMVGVMFVGCNNTPADKPEDTTPKAEDPTTPPETTAAPKDEPKTYNGKSYVGMAQFCGWAEWNFDITAVNATTATYVAMYKRNRQIENELDVKISQVKPSGDAYTLIGLSVLADTPIYNIVFVDAEWGLQQSASAGYLYDMKKLPGLDITSEGWDQSSVADLTIKNQLFMAAGDIHLGSFDNAWILAYNTAYPTNYATVDSPFDKITANNWTIPEFAKIVKAASNDEDGNGEWDENDRYGLATYAATGIAMLLGTGARISVKDADDVPQLALSDSESAKKYNDICTVLMDYTTSINPHIPQHDGCDYEGSFRNGKSMFFGEVIGSLPGLGKQMTDDYAVIPWPKATSDQSRYYTMVHFSGALVAIPSGQDDAEFTGTVTQALADLSVSVVRPAYNDIYLQQKVLRDKASSALDLVFDNKIYDPALAYRIGGLYNVLRNLFQTASTEIVSAIEAERTNYKASLNELLTNIEKNVG